MRYQWSCPNVWPPLVYLSVNGLRHYGFVEDVKRIASKYLKTTQDLFARTRQLWEKSNALTGDVSSSEYDAAPMIGWTSGVYIALAELLSGADE